jgi:hypothetical protein
MLMSSQNERHTSTRCGKEMFRFKKAPTAISVHVIGAPVMGIG